MQKSYKGSEDAFLAYINKIAGGYSAFADRSLLSADTAQIVGGAMNYTASTVEDPRIYQLFAPAIYAEGFYDDTEYSADDVEDDSSGGEFIEGGNDSDTISGELFEGGYDSEEPADEVEQYLKSAGLEDFEFIETSKVFKDSEESNSIMGAFEKS